MATGYDTDVLVAGGGPVGLFTALMLAREGIKVSVLEEQWRPASRSYALGLHPESLRILGGLGLAAHLMERGNVVETLGLYGGGRRQAEIDLRKLPGEFPAVLVLPQHLLEHVLIGALEKAGGKLLWNHRLASFTADSDAVEARVDRLVKESTGYSVTRTEWTIDKTLDTRCRFLIGADGHRSTVRRSLNIGFPASAEANTFAVFEFSAVGPPVAEMQIVLEKDSTNVLWPLPEGRYRWSFELGDFDDRPDPRVKSRLFVQFRDQPFPHVAEEKLAELVSERASWCTLKPVEVLWSAAVRFERRLAEKFGEGRVWLIGDSAHLALPIGIQSMNIAFREAVDLSSHLSATIKKNRPLESVSQFGISWRKTWIEMLERAEAPSLLPSAAPWIRERAPQIPSCIPASGEDLTRLLAQVGIG